MVNCSVWPSVSWVGGYWPGSLLPRCPAYLGFSPCGVGLGMSDWETVLSWTQEAGWGLLFLPVLSARYWVLCPSSRVPATLHSFYLFRLLQSACSAAPVRPSSPPWTTWIPPPASTDPHALPPAGCQPSQVRILTHFGHLNWKQQCKSDQKESGDYLTTRQGFNNWWIPAAINSIFEVLEFPSLTTYFLADILFIVIAVVSFCIFVGDGHSCATR